MADRLTRITTRTGDDGTTGLGDGQRVPKTALRIAALGDVDELNCALGVVLAHATGSPLREPLAAVQHRLFDLGATLAVPGTAKLDDGDVAALDGALERLNATLPPLREFLLPGGSAASAYCHLARAICRRAERALWALHATEPVNGAALRYLNRLSDLLFVAARALSREDGAAETVWQPKPPPGQAR
jgi:cob(I)alamin adenosyltransferase